MTIWMENQTASFISSVDIIDCSLKDKRSGSKRSILEKKLEIGERNNISNNLGNEQRVP